MKINACLDDGSHTSFISERAVSYLGLKRNNRDVSVKTLNGAESHIASATVTFEVRGLNGKTKREITALICPNAVIGDYEPVDWTKLKPRFAHLAACNFLPPVQPLQVNLLIG